MPETYAARDKLLLSLGYPSYGAYLESPLWKVLRQLGFTVNGRSCHLCRRHACVLHHTSYSEAVLMGQDTSHLVPLCDGCHRRVEFNKDGSKRSMDDANRNYHRMLSGKPTKVTVKVRAPRAAKVVVKVKVRQATRYAEPDPWGRDLDAWHAAHTSKPRQKRRKPKFNDRCPTCNNLLSNKVSHGKRRPCKVCAKDGRA